MKVSLIILFATMNLLLQAQPVQEKEITTEVDAVTVFIEGAQVTRRKKVDISSGNSLLKFTGLSPFIDAKSVQVKASGSFTVLSVHHQQNYLNKTAKSNEVDQLQKQKKDIEEKVVLEKTYLLVIGEELQFLKDNRNLGGKNQEVNLVNLKQTADYYGSKITALKLKEINHQKNITDLELRLQDLDQQLKMLAGTREYPEGVILVKVKADAATSADFELSYLVGNTGWFPSYDIRAKSIDDPVQIVYKANLRQDTKVDWKNIELTFSSSDPTISGTAPKLQTYFLDYYSRPPIYNQQPGLINGKVTDNEGETLPGVNVLVEGTTIGTVTNQDGFYSLSIPPQAGVNLVFSMIGFVSQTIPANSGNINIVLEPDVMELQEVVVTGYGGRKKGKNNVPAALQGRAAGVMYAEDNIMVRGNSSIPVPSEQVNSQTAVEFRIKTPYTINSDNKSYAVDMDRYSLKAGYEYYAVPKINRDAFLVAYLLNWESLNLLEGEANIFFEDTYVGKTILDLKAASDTLSLSLGRDKGIRIQREKAGDFTTRQFIGNKKEESRSWKLTVKNNKRQKIRLILYDQVPVSTMQDIEVEVKQTSNGKLNEASGEVKWLIELEPNQEKKYELNYSVKYPKNRSLVIE
jgi:hypothetical protein